jgi:hypothetical protein
MNTTSLPTQASVASWPSLNVAVSTQSSATSIVLVAAVQGESDSFLATARTWLRDLFTPPSTQDLERRCLPSVAFTPGGPLVYQWQISSLSFMISTTEPPSPCRNQAPKPTE